MENNYPDIHLYITFISLRRIAGNMLPRWTRRMSLCEFSTQVRLKFLLREFIRVEFLASHVRQFRGAGRGGTRRNRGAARRPRADVPYSEANNPASPNPSAGDPRRFLRDVTARVDLGVGVGRAAGENSEPCQRSRCWFLTTPVAALCDR